MVTDMDGWLSNMKLLFVMLSVKYVVFLVCVAYLPPSYSDEQCLNIMYRERCMKNFYVLS